MKIGIMTIIDYQNYGNRLQNYALQQVLKEYDAEIVTILNEKYRDYHYKKHPIIGFILHLLHEIYWNLYDNYVSRPVVFQYEKDANCLMRERIKKNREFSKRYINESSYVIREGVWHKKQIEELDFVFAGSDQIWNPQIFTGSGMFFLQYVPPKKRISFAASFGTDSFQKKDERILKKYLSEMKILSVREATGAQIVKKLTGRDAKVLLDPTMLIKLEQWQQLIKTRKNSIHYKYVLTYILGEISEPEQICLKKYVNKHDVKLVMLNDKRFPEWYALDVIDFLRLIADAEMVLTDSYHACVFSILFYKEFYVFKRIGQLDNIYTRIDNLLKVFSMEDRKIELESLPEMKSKVEIIEKNKIESILNREREVAKQFLDSVLKNRE